MKKVIRIPLSVALILGFSAPAFAAFSDVSRSHPYAGAIAHVQAEGIVSGYPDGTFRPDQNVNRAEFTKIVIGATFTERALGFCDPNHIYDYSDVDSGVWYAKHLCLAVQHNIVSGYSDGTFRPEVGINAAEAAKIIASTDILDAGGHQVGTLPIVIGGAWYEQYMIYLADRNALPASVQYPEQSITRGELAEMIYKLSLARSHAQTPINDNASASSQTPFVASVTQYVPYVDGVIGNGQTAVLYFYAPWCPYCRANDARLEDWFAQGLPDFAVYKVDYDTAAALKGRYGVAVQDTFIKIDGKGDILGSISLPSEATLQAFLGV